MFNRFAFSQSGVKIFESLGENVAGFDPDDQENPHVRDLVRKRQERGRANLQSENSEDALSYSWWSSSARLPYRDWLVDFFRAAVTERFAQKYAPLVDQAQIKFWVQYSAPQCLQDYLRARLIAKGERALAHLEPSARLRAEPRLQKILAGDLEEMPEHDTEIDVEIRIGQELLVFCECKLYSDCSFSTFSPRRTQVLRNVELVDYIARRDGIKDARFILLTMERNGRLHPNALKAMKRYRGSDMRRLRSWDEIGEWKRIKQDLPHRADEPDSYFQRLTQQMGWATFPECTKILAHHAVPLRLPCAS